MALVVPAPPAESTPPRRTIQTNPGPNMPIAVATSSRRRVVSEEKELTSALCS